ncbi:hypothetical protein POM88_052408 [Heracleum sosnowskyi]|uniref:GDSL esterase/lipase n=1 Tax=Heracleum sosnowskyi TaxID=360622 RepID=A0AAD8GRK3_9APIA|nr:hypothetical protein POM88_052408 [Heracleum sosnowskyi]
MYVYCETIEETQVEEITLSEYAYPNTTQELEFEKQQILDILNSEGIPEDMYDIDHLLNKPICDEQTSEVSDHDNVSFHEDSSNIDSTDEDVRSQKAKMVDVPIETLNWNTEVVDSDFSDCIDSDEERMVGNSTDEEDDERRFPGFNEETDMANPQFEIVATDAAAQSLPPQRPRAFFVFGDSLVDNGNNNYLITTARADLPALWH